MVGRRGCNVIAAAVLAGAGAGWAQTRPVVIEQQAATAPFTVSKETTAVTGPLRDDGSVDYLGAWNQKYGTGVKAEENGFAGFLRVMGSDALPAKTGEAMERMVGAQRAAPGQELVGFIRYLQQQGHDAGAVNALDDQMAAMGGRLWKEEDFPELAAYFKDEAEQLGLVAEAARRPKWWMPAVSSDGRTMMGVLLPSLSRVREAGRLLCARATLRAGAGDFAGFLADVATAKKLARQETGEFVIGVLVGVAMDAAADDAIGVVAGRGELTEAQCGELRKQVEEIGAVDGLRPMVDVAERWGMLDVVQQVATGHGVLLEGATQPPGVLASITLREVDWDAVLRRVNEAYDEEVKMLDMRGREERQAAWDAFGKRMEAGWPEEERTLPAAVSLMKRAKETREQYTARVGGALLAMFLPSLNRAGELERQGAMRQEMTVVLLAAAAHKARTGKWPANAEEMVPGEVKALAVDVAGKPVRLEVDKEGAAVVGMGERAEVRVGVPGEAGK